MRPSRALGHVDVLINNAGLGGEVNVVDMTDEQWNRVLDVTLNSVFRMTRAFLPHMYERKIGCHGQQCLCSRLARAEGASPLCGGQGGGDGLHPLFGSGSGRTWRADQRGRAQSSRCTPFLAKVTTDELLAKLSAQEAFGRPAEVWEVANVMIFLASDLSSYMTGEIVSVSSQRLGT